MVKQFGTGVEGKRIEVECEKCNFCNLHFWGRLMGIRVGGIGQLYDDRCKMACLYKDEQEKEHPQDAPYGLVMIMSFSL